MKIQKLHFTGCVKLVGNYKLSVLFVLRLATGKFHLYGPVKLLLRNFNQVRTATRKGGLVRAQPTQCP